MAAAAAAAGVSASEIRRALVRRGPTRLLTNCAAFYMELVAFLQQHTVCLPVVL
uniref:Uncharacterized protein n=1 Tax=Oryza barthii TaxID=65489 RepID=A0A0D3F0P2_9ORYZ